MGLTVRSIAFLFLFAASCSDAAPSNPGTTMGSGGAATGSATTGSGGTTSVGADGGAGATAGATPATTGGAGAGGASSTGGSGGDGPSGSGGAPMIDAAAMAEGGDAARESGGGGSPAGGDAGEGGAPATFNCSLIIGPFQASQWFDGGFETAVGTAKWEIKWAHNTFTERWANPADAFWNTEVASPCANGATSPDRVLYIAYSMTLTTQAAWETQLTKVVDNLKSKFPSAKQIQLLGMVRAPNNQMCPGNSNTSTIVRPEEDQAMQAVADGSGGLVQVGPKYFAPSCDSFVANNTNLTAAGASAVATTLSAIYK